MKKMFCMMVLGVWALCSQVMADPQSLLSKIPDTYDWAGCVDTKQLDTGTFMVLDMLKGPIPKVQNQNSTIEIKTEAELEKSEYGIHLGNIKLMKEMAAIYGINPDTAPFIVFAVQIDASKTYPKVIILVETSVQEQKMIEFLNRLSKDAGKGEISEEKTVGNHKVYKYNPKNADTKEIAANYFTFLDDKTLVLASDIDSLTEMETLRGKHAHFLHQDDVSRNHMIWFGSNENSDLSTKYYKTHVSDETPAQERPGYRNFYGFVSLDQANYRITSEFNIEATDSESAMKMDSMFQMLSSALVMTSSNPSLIKDSFQITNRACKLFGKVKIDKAVCEVLAKMFANSKATCGSSGSNGISVSVGQSVSVEEKEVPVPEKKGLTIKHE